MFVVDVKKNIVKITQTEFVTSGSRNVYVTRFELSEEWDPLVATAVFKAGNQIVNILLDEDRECMIPWEVMVVPEEEIYVGVFGTMDGNVVLPTIWGKMQNILVGVTTGLPSSPPTPDVYQQILDRLRKMQLEIDEGIPYALEAFIDTKIDSMKPLEDVDLDFPCNAIIMDSDFSVPTNEAARDGIPDLHYHDMIVYLEQIVERDETNVVNYTALRITDFIGYVWEMPYDQYDPDKKFTDRVLIRDTRGPKGETGEVALSYAGEITMGADKDHHETAILLSKDRFSREPLVGDAFVATGVYTGEPGRTYLGTFRVTVNQEGQSQVTVIVIGSQDMTGGIGPQGPRGYTSLWFNFETTANISINQTQIGLPPDNFSHTPTVGEKTAGVITVNADTRRDIGYFYGEVTSADDDLVNVSVETSFSFYGPKGDTGLTQLECNAKMSGYDKPIIGSTTSYPASYFNRLPVVDDVFTFIFSHESRDDAEQPITYLVLCVVNNVTDSTATFTITSMDKLTGPKGDKGDQALVYKSTIRFGGIPEENVIGMTDLSSFNREPQIGETFFANWDLVPAVGSDVGVLFATVTHKTDTQAQFRIGNNTVVVTKGIQGEVGLKGDTGEVALVYNSVRSSLAIPTAGNLVELPSGGFNRTPVVGDTFINIVKLRSTPPTTFLLNMEVKTVDPVNNITSEILSVVEITGPKGETGNGIETFQQTSGNHAPGTTDEYTISMTDGTTTTIPVYNGANGQGTVDVHTATVEWTPKDDPILEKVIEGSITMPSTFNSKTHSSLSVFGYLSGLVMVAPFGSDTNKLSYSLGLSENSLTPLSSVVNVFYWPSNAPSHEGLVQGGASLGGGDSNVATVFTKSLKKTDLTWNDDLNSWMYNLNLTDVISDTSKKHIFIFYSESTRLTDVLNPIGDGQVSSNSITFFVNVEKDIADSWTLAPFSVYIIESDEDATMWQFKKVIPNNWFDWVEGRVWEVKDTGDGSYRRLIEPSYDRYGPTYLVQIYGEWEGEWTIEWGAFRGDYLSVSQAWGLVYRGPDLPAAEAEPIKAAGAIFAIKGTPVVEKDENWNVYPKPQLLYNKAGSSDTNAYLFDQAWADGTLPTADSNTDSTVENYLYQISLTVPNLTDSDHVIVTIITNKFSSTVAFSRAGDSLILKTNSDVSGRPEKIYVIVKKNENLTELGKTYLAYDTTVSDTDLPVIPTNKGGTGMALKNIGEIVGKGILGLSPLSGEHDQANIRVPFADSVANVFQYMSLAHIGQAVVNTNTMGAAITNLPPLDSVAGAHLFSNMKMFFFDPVLNNSEELTAADVIRWCSGRTDGQTLYMPGTDYTAQRARAISLHTTLPTEGLINGALYGIYS